MNLVLGEHFRRDDNRRHSDWLRKRQWFIKAKETRAKKEEMAAQAEEELLSFAAGAIAATSIEIEQFEAKLDTYDESIVIALMENQKALDVVNTEFESLLNRAHVMEDGRRVFKTEDGSQVFDENGAEVSRKDLDFDDFKATNPTWEQYEPVFLRKQGLQAERVEIIGYQEKVDAARERVADGEISKDELDELDAELTEAMPEAVRIHVPGMDEKPIAPKLSTEFEAQSGQAPNTTMTPVRSGISQPVLDFSG